jgi:hypothetical protein
LLGSILNEILMVMSGRVNSPKREVWVGQLTAPGQTAAVRAAGNLSASGAERRKIERPTAKAMLCCSRATADAGGAGKYRCVGGSELTSCSTASSPRLR